MKGDFSRLTFNPSKHYKAVRMQQGRVQVDADWNEQSDIFVHRLEIEARDVVGACGAPRDEPGFHVVARWNDLTAEEKALAGNAAPPALAGDNDFFISAGRYYVDGMLCENERIATYQGQNGGDLPDPPPLTDIGRYLIYLDVWPRHLTALDAPSIREVALGGPDTATRIKTAWRVKWWHDASADVDCESYFDKFRAALPPRDGTLSAQAQPAPADPDPCIIPPSAGYRGLENQLYRVEIHHPGVAYDVQGGANAFLVMALPSASPNQITVGGGTWAVGDVIEVFRTVAGSDPMAGFLAQVVKKETASTSVPTATERLISLTTLTLNRNLPGLRLADLPRVRQVTATLKWSRDNGSVVTAIEKLDGKQITVHDLGPDSVLGFAPGQWVEITDDALELNARPAQLAQIADVNPGTRVITLTAAVTSLGTIDGVNPNRHPKLRRWDGFEAIKHNPSAPAADWQNLEAGIQVQFSAGHYVTGDYWLIPARTATAEADSGRIEWPQGVGGAPLPLPPAGIEHYYCPLGLLSRSLTPDPASAAPGGAIRDLPERIINIGAMLTTGGDCRCVFSPLTHLTGFFYVGGDGQEAMPGDPMPQLLQVGVFNVGVSNICTTVGGARVRFTTQVGGQVAATRDGLAASGSSTIDVDTSLSASVNNTIDVVTGPDGIASCAWRLAADPRKPSQQVEARLVDASGVALDPVVRFTGNLSIAAQVAYTPPADCPDLKDAATVQQALDALCHRPPGCVVPVRPGQELTQVIGDLVDAGRSDLCLCLQPGDHQFGVDGVDLKTVTQPGLRLEIVGCGLGTRLALSASFNADQLAAVTLRDLDIRVQPNRRMDFNRCGEVTLDSCHLAGTTVSKDALCFIREAERIVLRNNVVRAEAVNTIPVVAVPLGTVPFGAVPGGAVPVPGVAVVIEDGHAGTWLEDNDIFGVVSLYGLPDGTRLEQEHLKNLKSHVVLEPFAGVLHFRNNRVTAITIGQTMLEQIQNFNPVPPAALAPPAALGRGRRVVRAGTAVPVGPPVLIPPPSLGNLILKGVYRTGYLSHNILRAPNNTLVVGHLVLTANHFETQNGDAGAVIADSAVYMGNYAPNDIRLFSLAQKQQPAANLVLNNLVINIVPII